MSTRDRRRTEPAWGLAEASAYLEAHVNYERMAAGDWRTASPPTFERMQALCALLGDPHRSAPVVHITGTNGKGSTARIASALLAASGLTVGLYTSPHLETVTERIVVNGEPIADDVFAAVLRNIAELEPLLPSRLTHFEVLTAAAFAAFADDAVDVVVLEVGLGGTWDSTNIATADVAVVTNVALDHAEIIGPTRLDIATEKAGIVEPTSVLVLGETDPELVPVFEDRGPVRTWLAGRDWECVSSRVAVGGRVLDLRTPVSSHEELFLPLHGPHQGDNAACALTAVEAFFGERGIDDGVVAEAFASVRVPGRFEVVRRHPLVVLDGAHNPAGAAAARVTIEEDFAAVRPTCVVLGMLAGRDPADMLGALGLGSVERVIACPAPSPRTLAPAEVAGAARALGVRDVDAVDSVEAAVAMATGSATEDDFILVTGSLYVVGAARAWLRANFSED